MARPDPVQTRAGRSAAGRDAAAIDAERRAELERLSKLAGLMDDAFRVPGTNLRFGLDGIAGLIPGVGDALSAAVSAYLIGRAVGLGAPVTLAARMTLNLAIDLIAGAVPVAGDLFDFGFRANRKNVELLRRWLAKTAP